MAPVELECAACKASDRKGAMREAAPGRFTCGTCETSIDLNMTWELPRLLHDVQAIAEKNYPRIKDPPRLGTQHLREQFHDARLNLLFGRYNATIVTLSVFVECLVREAIFLDRNLRFSRPMQAALNYCREHKVLRVADIHWLEDFKDDVRNVWLHQDIERIAHDMVIPGWVIELPKADMLRGLNNALEEIRGGKRKRVLFRARDHPWAADAAKQIVAEREAFRLYDRVWDFTVHFNTRYLKTEAYDSWRRRFGKADPVPAP